MQGIPVACSLDGLGMKTRSDEWRELIVPNVVDRRVIPSGAGFSLRTSPDVHEELKRLVALESSCCAWIDWTVDAGEVLRVEATAEQEQGVALLRDWFGPDASLDT